MPSSGRVPPAGRAGGVGAGALTRARVADREHARVVRLGLLASALGLALLTACGGEEEPRVDGRYIAEWRAALSDTARPTAERRRAANALGRLGAAAPGEVVDALAAARSSDPDEEVRR